MKGHVEGCCGGPFAAQMEPFLLIAGEAHDTGMCTVCLVRQPSRFSAVAHHRQLSGSDSLPDVLEPAEQARLAAELGAGRFPGLFMNLKGNFAFLCLKIYT